nr:serine acetyltransferase [uncultured Macellibacteroides sp.]
MKNIAIYGACGFGREIACLIRIKNQNEPTWNLIGYFDDALPKGTVNKYGSVLGNIDILNNWNSELAVTLAIGNPTVLKKIVEKISNKNIYYPNIISPDIIYLDKSSLTIGIGNIICSRCMFSCNISIESFNIFNSYITIGHDTKLGSYNVVMPSVNISGEVSAGDSNFMGVSSVILQQIRIGNNVRVGAGSVIIKKTKDNTLYVGNPAVKMEF